MKDSRGRSIDYLRISVTDRCNLRCIYCMPEEGATYASKEDLLTYEEIMEVVYVAADLGVKKIRLTGGEPLVRDGLPQLIKEISQVDGVEEVSLTTNGLLLYEMIDQLAEAGLNRVNLSLDSLKADVFENIVKKANLSHLMKGLKRTLDLGLKVRINVVLLQGINDGEALDFVEFIKKYPVDVRFIELMPIGRGRLYKGRNNVELIEEIKAAGYKLEEVKHTSGSGPARYFELDGGLGDLGFISPMSHQFCDSCNRIRLTSEGFLKLCLHSGHGIDLKALLRKRVSRATLKERIATAIGSKPDQHQFGKVDSKEGFNEDIDEAINEDTRHMNQIGG